MKNSTKLLTLITLTLLLVFSFSSCNKKVEENKEIIIESTFNLATAKDEIGAANKELAAFIAATDSIGLSKLYTQDAKVMMTGAPSINGRNNIQSTMSGMMKSGISRLDLKTIEVWGTEDLITEEGEYSLFAGDTKVDYGKYMVLWKKEEGKWQMHRDVISSDVPPAE